MPASAIRTAARDQLSIIEMDGVHSHVAATIQGAHVIDWRTQDARPVLFLSPRSQFLAGRAIRGGVPLCFPWFGPKPDDSGAPQHGFARTRDWVVEQAEVMTDGTARLELRLEAGLASREMWPHEFSARYSIRAGRSLELALTVHNCGSTPFAFGAALHTYLAVSDVRQISLRGLEHTDYLDKVGGRTVRRREGAEPITFSSETDRVYLDTTATCVVDDPGWARRIHVAKSGSRSTVIWNPWTDKARAMADLGEDAWPGFVCVETCNAADDTITLAPGTSHTLAAGISVETTTLS